MFVPETSWIPPVGTYQKIYKDFLSQHHLLLGGCTGSGKSTIINAMIYTALYELPGDTTASGAPCVQFILIDPKRVDLSLYRDLPHTIEYASAPQERLHALTTAVSIMEARYISMQADRLREYPGGHIYVIIDEWADIAVTQGKAARPLVQRLTQLGRAAHIHVILATQCPLTKLLPSEIRSNFPAKVGLHTTNASESRVILDEKGCENVWLGECLYKRPMAATRKYLVPMYSDEDLEERVWHWVKQKRRIA